MFIFPLTSTFDNNVASVPCSSSSLCKQRDEGEKSAALLTFVHLNLELSAFLSILRVYLPKCAVLSRFCKEPELNEALRISARYEEPLPRLAMAGLTPKGRGGPRPSVPLCVLPVCTRSYKKMTCTLRKSPNMDCFKAVSQQQTMRQP